MRTKKSFWIIIAAFALCATPIQAQGFGSILKIHFHSTTIQQNSRHVNREF